MIDPIPAIHSHAAAIDALDADRCASLFAPGAEIHDPVGAPAWIGPEGAHRFLSQFIPLLESAQAARARHQRARNSPTRPWRLESVVREFLRSAQAAWARHQRARDSPIPPDRSESVVREFLRSCYLRAGKIQVNANQAAFTWAMEAMGKNGRTAAADGINVVVFASDGRIERAYGYWDPSAFVAVLLAERS